MCLLKQGMLRKEGSVRVKGCLINVLVGDITLDAMLADEST